MIHAVARVALVALAAPTFVLAVGQDAPRTVGNTFQAGEESTWVFESAGARIGHHTSSYVGREDLGGVRAHRFHGSCELAAPGLGDVRVRFAADLWTDDAAHPIRFVMHSLVGEQYSRVELTALGKTSPALVVQGRKPRELVVDVDPAAYLLANNFVSHLELLVALLPPGEDAHVALFSGNTLQGLRYALEARGAFEDEVDGREVKGHVYEDSLGERLRFVDGRLVDCTVASQKLVIRRTPERFEPITIVPPAPAPRPATFASEDVRIPRGAATIAGSVTKPKGATGRLPAIFFVSGSGAQDRDGNSNGIDLGTREILDHLTESGYLVLRVDDRGAGESSPPPPDTSFLDLVDDARACVAFLAGREDVDPRRLVLIGHSEGGETVPILAAEKPAIAAIVLMAAPGRSVIEIIADQNRDALVGQGKSGAELERAMRAVRAFLARLAGDDPIDAATLDEDERAALASRAWIQSHAKQDPIANLKQVKCPVLILQGALDFQVSPEKDAAALERALAEARHPDHELRVLPGLDHLFKKVAGPKSELAEYWKRRPVDATFLAALDAWLQPRLSPAKR